MTAFARKQTQQKEGTVNWEIRSVNSRYLDMNFRLPEMFRELEPQLRNIMAKHVQRGKVEVSLRFQPGEVISSEVIVNRTIVTRLNKALSQIKEIMPGMCDADPVKILAWPGVMQEIKGDNAAIFQRVLCIFSEACKELEQMKLREGEKLQQFIQQRLTDVTQKIAAIRKQMPDILQKQQENLLAKFAEIKVSLDQERLEQEMVLFAQKIDISEEVDRLDAHISEVHTALQQSIAVGRRLDFLMQEMNREANTIASKSASADTTKIALDLKVLIEQMREQVQNIE
jgi:uncharacterized protein (TIGR00255 family)